MTLQAAPAAGEMNDPGASGWGSAASEAVSLQPVALDAQPNDYIRTKWSNLSYGTIGQVDVALARDGDALLVRLEWSDGEGDSTEFPDAAAVYFPDGDGAPAATIGSTEQPVTLWHWQEGREAARQMTARGPGVFRPAAEDAGLAASASLEGGRWSVVLRGPSAAVAATQKLGVAVWNGSNEERAGLGSVSTDWISVELGN